MGGMWTTLPSYLDLLEEVACQSSILLTDHEIKDLATKTNIQPLEEIQLARKNTGVIRISFDDVEASIIGLRAAIGNLPDRQPGSFAAMKYLRTPSEETDEVTAALTAFDQIVKSGKYKVLGQEAAEEITMASGVPKRIVDTLFEVGWI